MMPVYADANNNTFLIFDCINNNFKYLKMLFWFYVKKVDSCLVLYKYFENKDELIIKMIVYFPKGGFCGNGARAVSHYLHHKYKKKKYGIYLENKKKIDLIKFNNSFLTEIILSDKFEIIIIQNYKFYMIEIMSEPHLVIFDKITQKKFIKIAEEVQKYQNGINLNHCKILENNKIEVKTWERGIKRFTKSCGTGILSCFQIAFLIGKLVKNNTKYFAVCEGGELTILKNEDKIYLMGKTKIKYLNIKL